MHEIMLVGNRIMHILTDFATDKPQNPVGTAPAAVIRWGV